MNATWKKFNIKDCSMKKCYKKKWNMEKLRKSALEYKNGWWTVPCYRYNSIAYSWSSYF